MTPGRVPSESSRWYSPPALRDPVLATGLAVAMGALGGVPYWLALIVPVAGAAVALFLRSLPNRRAAEYGLAPFFVAVGGLAVLAVPSLIVAILAALTGLAALLWNSRVPGEPAPPVDPLEGLLVPALGVAVAIGVAVTLPTANEAVGLAALAVVGALGLLLWGLGRTLESGDPTSEAL